MPAGSDEEDELEEEEKPQKKAPAKKPASEKKAKAKPVSKQKAIFLFSRFVRLFLY